MKKTLILATMASALFAADLQAMDNPNDVELRRRAEVMRNLPGYNMRSDLVRHEVTSDVETGHKFISKKTLQKVCRLGLPLASLALNGFVLFSEFKMLFDNVEQEQNSQIATGKIGRAVSWLSSICGAGKVSEGYNARNQQNFASQAVIDRVMNAFEPGWMWGTSMLVGLCGIATGGYEFVGQCCTYVMKGVRWFFGRGNNIAEHDLAQDAQAAAMAIGEHAGEFRLEFPDEVTTSTSAYDRTVRVANAMGAGACVLNALSPIVYIGGGLKKLFLYFSH